MAGAQGGSWWNPLDNIGYWADKVDNQLTGAVSQQDSGAFTPKTTQPIATIGDGGYTDVLGASTRSGDSGGNAIDPTPTNSTTTYDAQAAAKAKNTADTNLYLDDKEARLRALLGDINLTRSQGITQLGDSYNTEKQSGEQKYGQQSEDNTRSKINALDAVDTKARTGYNSLRSIIGHSGSANQSAGMVARDAVARQASQDRQKQVDTSAMNERDITNARQMFLNDLEAKRKERESSLLADLLNQENSVYGDLQDLASQRVTNNSGGYEQVRAAIAPLQGEIDSRKSQLQGLFDKYRTPFNAEQKLATLSQFNVDPTAINANAQTGAGDFSPYANFLKRRQQTV